MQVGDEELKQIKRIINEGIVIQPNQSMSEYLYNFTSYSVGKEIFFGVNSEGVWFRVYSYILYLKDYLKTWWYKTDK